jgi:HEAT repeat protein
MLSGGDLRSDGMANEAVRLIRENPFLIYELIEGMIAKDNVIRGRSADVLEKLTRDHPEFAKSQVDFIIRLALNDPVPMVRWHAAMILSNLIEVAKNVDKIYHGLLAMLDDHSAIVKCWAISGLCYLGRKRSSREKQILQRLASLERDPSVAVRHRAVTAMKVLLNNNLPMPTGWIKSQKSGQP